MEIDEDEPLQLKGEAKTEYDADLKICKAKLQAMEKYLGQAFSMIKGQCTLAPKTKMKCDNDYTDCMAPSNPLQLKALIERTIISQSANKYTFAVLYELEVGLLGVQQNKVSVNQWLEWFNTKVDIGDTLGVNQDHPMALKHVAQELCNKKFEDLSNALKINRVTLDARERYLAYIFLRQSSSEHDTYYETQIGKFVYNG
jgi:hypothetical protein